MKIILTVMQAILLTVSLLLLSSGVTQYINDLMELTTIQRLDKNVFIVVSVSQSQGTAYQIEYNNKKYLVTNHHVCESSVQMKVGYDKEVMLDVDVLITDKENDLCIMSPVKPEGGLLLSTNINVFSEYYYMGFPSSIKTRRKGSVEHKREMPFIEYYIYDPFEAIKCILEGNQVAAKNEIAYCIKYHLRYLITAEAAPGASGSPVVDRYGNVIGTIDGINDRGSTFIESQKTIDLITKYEKEKHERRND